MTAEAQLGPLLGQLAEELAERVADRTAELLAERLRAPEPSGWLNVEQAAEYLAASPSRIYDLTAAGRLRCAKDGRRSVYKGEWLDQCLVDEDGR